MIKDDAIATAFTFAKIIIITNNFFFKKKGKLVVVVIARNLYGIKLIIYPTQ